MAPWNKGKKFPGTANKSSFKTGGVPWNKGLRNWMIPRNKGKFNCISDSTREKMSKAKLGKSPWNKGIPMSETAKQKMISAKKGTIPWNKGKHNSITISNGRRATETRLARIRKREALSLSNTCLKDIRTKFRWLYGTPSSWAKGKTFTDGHRKKMSIAKYGERNHRFGKPLTITALTKLREKRRLQVLPVRDTKPEKAIQVALETLNVKYQKHKPIRLSSGSYHQVDIFIYPNICIEVDGEYWHRRPDTIKRDKFINRSLTTDGYVVIRIWESVALKSSLKTARRIIIDNNICADSTPQ